MINDTKLHSIDLFHVFSFYYFQCDHLFASPMIHCFVYDSIFFSLYIYVEVFSAETSNKESKTTRRRNHIEAQAQILIPKQ